MRMLIKIVCVGDVSLDLGEVGRGILGRLRPPLSGFVAGGRVDPPAGAYDERRGQYDGNAFLRSLLNLAGERILGVTELDLFTPGLNFIFGIAQCPGRAAVVSLNRLKPEFYGLPPDRGLLLERAVKECVHEIGHTFGLGHCGRKVCVMSFSNSVGDVDRKMSELCGECRTRLLAHA